MASKHDYERLDRQAVDLVKAGRLQEAEAKYRQALEIAYQMPDEVDVLQAANGNLAGLLLNQYRYQEAQPLLEEWARYNDMGFGVDDVNGQLVGRRMLTNVYVALREYDLAESVLNQRLASGRRTFGENSAADVLNLGTLALLGQLRNQTEETVGFIEQARQAIAGRPQRSSADREHLDQGLTAAINGSEPFQARESTLFNACLPLLKREPAPAQAPKPIPTLRNPSPSGICPGCQNTYDLPIPTAAQQPFLDELKFDNPATLAAALDAEEAVLVQLHAAVGALVGTNRRILVIKRRVAYPLSYIDVKELRFDKVGLLLSAVCQLVTSNSPYRKMSAKEADEASTALSIVRNQMSIWERGCNLLLAVRDARRCPNCGVFVPIVDSVGAPSQEPMPMDPLSFGESETLSRGLQAGEQILCQVHGVRFAKAMVVTDRRVLVVIGGDLYAFWYSDLNGVDVQRDHVTLLVKGQENKTAMGLDAVKSDHMLPCNDQDQTRFATAADLIRRNIARAESGSSAPMPAG